MADSEETPPPPMHQNGHRPGWLSRWFRRERNADQEFHAYRRLAMQLRNDLDAGSGSRCLMVTTPAGFSEVGIRVSIDLARFLAEEQDRRVLLVDAHFGRSGVAAVLGCPSAPGLLDILAQPAGSLERLLIPMDQDGVSFLPAGSSDRRMTGLLSGESVKAVLDAARGLVDDVVLACPPLLEDPTTLAFPAAVDCVLLLSVEGKTRMRDLDESQRTLVSCRARKVGLILTTARRGRQPGRR